MPKKRKIWDAIQEASNYQVDIDGLEHQIHKIGQELKNRRLTKEQKEEIYYHIPELASVLEIWEI